MYPGREHNNGNGPSKFNIAILGALDIFKENIEEEMEIRDE